MTGYILAAGFGTRFSPLTEHMPKALVPVGGITLLQHACSLLDTNGFSRIGANVHYRADDIFSFSKQLPYQLSLFHEKDRIRGTGGALYFARDFLNADSSFCVVNADIITTIDLQRIRKRFEDSGCVCALIAAPARGTGTIIFNPQSGEYEAATGEIPVPAGYAVADFIGIAMYRREFLELLRPDDTSVLPIWRRAHQQGFSVQVFVESVPYWIDVGSPRALATVHFNLLDGVCALKTAENIIIDSEERKAYPVQLQSDRRSNLGKYVWSDSAEISATARLTRSVVLKGTRVGKDRDIMNAIVTPWGDIEFGNVI